MDRAETQPTMSAAPWLILGVLLLLTILSTQYVWVSSRLAEKARFDNAAQATRDSVQYHLDTYVNVLMATSAHFAADDQVSRNDFALFIRQLDLPRRFPGVQAVGLSIRVPRSRLDSVVATIRRDAFPDFQVHPAGVREEYDPIVMIEPMPTPRPNAFGFDLATSPERIEAMWRARDTGQAAASRRVVLLNNKGVWSFLIYVPIYYTRVVPATVEERRSAIYGYVYAAFRAGDLLSGVFGTQQRPEVGFELYDGDRISAGQLMFASDPRPLHPSAMAKMRATIAGRHVSVLVFSHRPVLLGTPMMFAAATATGGVAISLLLFALIRVQGRARAHAEQTAQRLRISESELQQANRTKDEFLATLSHELRTPMTAIMGWSKLLGTESVDPETYAIAIDAIQKSGKAQAQLIDDLLDVSRITAGKMRVDASAVDLSPIVQAAVESVSPAADAKGVQLTTELPSMPVLVSGDAQRLQQVVWNLLANSVKFTQRGGSIVVRVRALDDEASIDVRDSGQGIAPDFLPHVFERFRQADSSSSRSYTGLGLGLAIVRHLVELHGGEVMAQSDGLGKGALFEVRLPRLVDHAGEAPDEASEGSDGTERLRGRRVLIVDDEEAVREYVSTVLRRAGCTVHTAASALQALEALATEPFDVVVSDLGMPQLDGFAMLARMRASADARVRRVPVIALTAYARPEDRQHALREGFAGFIPKPIEPEPLKVAVAHVLPPR